MKVFLSWSGDLSLKLALAFRDWLPSVIQAVKPYVSSEDIDKGTRWSTDIAKELEASSYGILCITSTNLDAPWINFEAGALSKAIDKANVSPFLFHVKRSEIQGPLLQFQSTVYEKDDVSRLVASINRRLAADEKLDEVLLVKSFDVWWPKLKEQLDALPVEVATVRPPDVREPHKNDAILEELLELARNQQKLLRSPETFIPPDYLDYILRRSRRDYRSPDELHDIAVSLEILLDEIQAATPESATAAKLQEQLRRLHDVTHRDLERREVLRRKRAEIPPKRAE